VEVLAGWFKDTLPTAPVDQLAVMRLDGDMYESEWQAIEALYPKLSPGGFCVIDDYSSLASQCGQAIDDYRRAHGITDEIIDIDGYGVFWRKSGSRG
jgi:O-methyltransferase